MLGIDRRTAHAVWTALVIFLGVWLVWLARTTIVLFALSLLFAYLLTPVTTPEPAALSIMVLALGATMLLKKRRLRRA